MNDLVRPVEFLIYAVLGIAGGRVSVVFSCLLLGIRATFLHLSAKTQWCHPVFGGLLVGVLGWFVPQVLGVGYGFIGRARNGQRAPNLMMTLVLLNWLRLLRVMDSGMPEELLVRRS